MTFPPLDPNLSSAGKPKRSAVWPWFVGVVALVVLDQATKLLVRTNLVLGHPIPVIGRSLVRFTYVQNPGIAFGVDILGLRPLLIFGWVAAVVLTVYLYRLARRTDTLRWPVMLFLAGAIGNSIDRLIFGQVTDFVDVDMPDFIMERFAVFNVADACVSIGIVLLAIIVLSAQKKTDERNAPGAAAPFPATNPASQGENLSNSELNVRPTDQSNSLPTDHSSGSATGTD
jgi:signal peptidase II